MNEFEKWFSENNTRLPTWYSNPYDEEALKIAYQAGAAAMRERCAEVAEKHIKPRSCGCGQVHNHMQVAICGDIAAAIRGMKI